MATVCLDPSRTALISLRGAGVAASEGAAPAARAPGEVLIEYPDDWSFAAASPPSRIDGAKSVGPRPNEFLRFVLEARNWLLVDLVFALREGGDEGGARLLAEELLELCPRLSREAIRRLRKSDLRPKARTRGTMRCRPSAK
jgi:hypothetical protein